MASHQSVLSQTVEYQSFRASVPLKKLALDPDEHEKFWHVFDCGPRALTCPLVCLPPISGAADVFFHQCLGLSARGFRVIAAESPAYWTVEAWCQGFKRLLAHLDLEKVHLFGAGLGGYLAQKFAEYTEPCPRVASLILCNAFTNTDIFRYQEQSMVFWLLPGPMLKNIVASGMECSTNEAPICCATEFMLERLNDLPQSILASRLTLNGTSSRVDPKRLRDLPITLLNVWDNYVLAPEVRDALCRSYPQAKMAHLKSGGNFPFLSRFDEVNMHATIHLRNFDAKP
ncbi:hypothetical protein TCAL_11443 [Tigriopus californicus]|uniref:Maspardin n=1 Tax=Tigriopus californicus TaxID=6832 RepID=A0A553NNL7_TIGCA|nr:maspardin-like [Tigriopus californicus]TRY67042.1 hypothetical protein TCAL_11443 [Tigriopus californicus]